MRLMDLFAGCGGMTTGFRRLGFKPVCAVESDVAAAATYAVNHDPRDEHTFSGTIEAFLETEKAPEVDVIIGGPPCQGFSALGKQDAEDPRNRLWESYVEVVAQARPKLFVIENVDRFLKSVQYERLQKEVAAGALEHLGYELWEGVLCAADFGVPQRRRRSIVIGSRIGPPLEPKPTHWRDASPRGKRTWTTVRDAIGGVYETTPRPDATDLPSRTVRILDSEVPGPFSMDEIHIRREPLPISLTRYDLVEPGGNRFTLEEALRERDQLDLLPPCWQRKRTGTTDVMGRLEWEKQALTIRTEFFKPEKGRYLHPQWERNGDRVNRPLTHLEAALLQTFPARYRWCGTKSQIARQIGNAVPPLMAREVARAVRERLRNPIRAD